MSVALSPKTVVPLYILHWNRPDECLRTVLAFLDQGLALQIKVIDNHSEPEALGSLARRLPAGVELIQLPENKGWGGAFNVTLREWLSKEGSEFCFVSAHDAIPAEHCLELLLNSATEDPKVGIACPEYGVPEIPQFSRLHYIRIFPVPPRASGTVEAVDMPYGTLMLFRRQCLQEIGLFDERYFAYGDEHEIGLRARQKHWKVVVAWGSVVVNPGTWTPSITRSYLFARNSLLLVRTYAGLSAAIVRVLLMIPNTIRMWLVPPKEGYAFSARARFAGMYDFIVGRYGAPPMPNR